MTDISLVKDIIKKNISKNNNHITESQKNILSDIILNIKLGNIKTESANTNKIYKDLYYDNDNNTYYVDYKGVKQDIINKEELLLTYLIEILLK